MNDIFEIHASFCRVFADPKRLRILWGLQEGEHSVTELAKLVGCTLPNISQHLRVMREQGMVATRREGRTIYYHLVNPKFLAGCRLVREGLLEELQRRGKISSSELEATG